MMMHRKIHKFEVNHLSIRPIHTQNTIQHYLKQHNHLLFKLNIPKHKHNAPEGRVAVGQLQCHHALGALQRQRTNCGELKHTIVLVHL